MATRLYFAQVTAAPVTPPTPGAEWEHNNNVSKMLLQTPDTSVLTSANYSPDAADDLVDKDSLLRQYVSDPLTAQTLSGNVKAQFQSSAPNANNHLFLTIKITVISNAGTTTLATLLAITRDTTNEVATASLTNRNFPSVATSSYVCAAGDRLCVEVGLGGTPIAGTGTNAHNGNIRFGCDASSGDLAENDTETALTYRPWLEFANTFTFQPTDTQPKRTMAIARQRRR